MTARVKRFVIGALFVRPAADYLFGLPHTHPSDDVVRVQVLEPVELLLRDGRQDGAVGALLVSGLGREARLGDQRVGDRGHPLKRRQGPGEVVAEVLQRGRGEQLRPGTLACEEEICAV
jgi:hypothetical protein